MSAHQLPICEALDLRVALQKLQVVPRRNRGQAAGSWGTTGTTCNLHHVTTIATYSINFHQFPSISISFHQFPSISINFHQFPSISINFHQFPSISINFNHIPIGYSHRILPSDVICSGKASGPIGTSSRPKRNAMNKTTLGVPWEMNTSQWSQWSQ